MIILNLTLRRHRMAALVIVAVVIALAIGALLAALGMTSLLRWGVPALVAVPAAVVVLWTRDERRRAAQLVLAAAQSASAHWNSVVGAALWVALSVYFQWTRSEPTQPAVRLAFDLVNAFGAMAVLGVPVFRWVVRSVSGHPTSIGFVVGQLLRGVAFYSLALWLLGGVGDEVYAVALAEPNKTAAVAAAIAIIWLIMNHPVRPASEPRAVALDGGTRRMIEIFRAESVNGRFGVAVVGPEGTKLPARGRLLAVGSIEGMATYRFEPDETAQTWVDALPNEVRVHGGATAVFSRHLQGAKYASVLLLGPRAVVEVGGYKWRSYWVRCYVDGTLQPVPATVLAAMGAARATPIPAPVEPPALAGSMAAAFAAVGAR